MLNTAFSIKAQKMLKKDYVLPDSLASIVKNENSLSDTSQEYRLQEVFTEEVWLKLVSMGLNEAYFEGKKVLDLCSGAGFLTYHILKRSNPSMITLVEISKKELNHSKKLLSKKYLNNNIRYVQGDVLGLKYVSEFDIVIGNSFLHHLYDIPGASMKFKKYLKSGGIFISLHEPTPAAIGLESGKFKKISRYVLQKNKYIEKHRFEGDDLVQRPFGGDVWIFETGDLKKIFMQSNFVDVQEVSWNLLRPLTVARKNLHLSKSKKTLNSKELAKFYNAIKRDAKLRKIIKPDFFGSIGIMARKK